MRAQRTWSRPQQRYLGICSPTSLFPKEDLNLSDQGLLRAIFDADYPDCTNAMPPKGGNAKKESGKAKKAENEVKKKETAAADRERQEAKKWDDGTRVDKGADARAKQEAAAAKKAEAARLLAEEEASMASSSKVSIL